MEAEAEEKNKMQSNEQKLRCFLGAFSATLLQIPPTNCIRLAGLLIYLPLECISLPYSSYTGWLPRPFIGRWVNSTRAVLRLNIELWRLIRNLLVQVPDRHEIAEEIKEKEEELQWATSNGNQVFTSSGSVSLMDTPL